MCFLPLSLQIVELELSQETFQAEKAKLQSQLDELQKSASTLNTSTDMEAQEEMIRKLKEELGAKDKELEARDRLEMALNEKDNRIKFLQDQLERMEESEGQLNKSLTDVEQLEGHLREQLMRSDSTERTGSSTGSLNYELELTKLRATEERLLTRIDELEETEKSLKGQLVDTKATEVSSILHCDF